AEDGIRDFHVTGVQTCALPISISGYGANTAWKELPGQDLLTQARSGVMWLSGGADDGPVAIGLPVADMLAGAALAQGILALLFRSEERRVGKECRSWWSSCDHQ